MIMELKVIDQENIHYLVRNLEDFEKDKAIRSGLRSAASVSCVREKPISVQECVKVERLQEIWKALLLRE